VEAAAAAAEEVEEVARDTRSEFRGRAFPSETRGRLGGCTVAFGGTLTSLRRKIISVHFLLAFKTIQNKKSSWPILTSEKMTHNRRTLEALHGKRT